MTTKKTLMWVSFWISLAAIFNVGIYSLKGQQKALEFLGGYIIELSLSVDNLFLFLIIFSSFRIPSLYQRRVLNYGIAGAIILRLIFVLLGITIVNIFHWVLYIFGLILIISGIKMMLKKDEARDFKKSKLIKLLSKIIPISDTLEGEKFFVYKNKILQATPLFAILILIEGSDIIFAIDSIPAIFSITTDPLIVYSSNIFAILGLRSMYFLIEKLQRIFGFVKYGVALILTFTGIKLSIGFFHIDMPIIVTLAVIFSILILSIIASVLFYNKKSTGTQEI